MNAGTLRTGLAWLLAIGALLALASLGPGAGSGVGGKPRVALFVNGTLGDKSFYDAAARGLKNARASLGLHTRVVEGGTDPTRWEAALTDLADSGDFDIIVTGTFTMVPLVQKLAQQYPKVRFVVFDAAVDHARCGCANVYSMLFRQNEGAYLAGFLAARLAGEARSVGVVGGMQFPVIDDFIVGFSAGARAAEPQMNVARQYVNSFSDPATAKEIASALYRQGAAVLFQAAGGSGHGVMEAAAEAHRLAIGVDIDQYQLYRASNPEQAGAIITSVLKDVDVGIERALRLALAGQLRWGQAESIGLAEHGVSLARSSPLLQRAPPALLAELDAVEHRIVAGAVVVPSAFAGGGAP